MLKNDHPLELAQNDTLNRASFAQSIARRLLLLTAPQSIVVGIQGPWGSGKSSILNFMAEVVETDTLFEEMNLPQETAKPIIIRFNPWWFSGQEDLFSRFFQELGAQIGRSGQLEKVAKAVSKISQVARLLSLMGIAPEIIPQIGEVGVKILKGDESLDGIRREVIKLLADAEHPIWVFIDDVERLQANEIKQMFSLVRSVGDLPYVRYVLAYDPITLESAIDDAGSSGERYVEKVVQVPFTVPQPTVTAMERAFFTAIDAVVIEARREALKPEFDRATAVECFSILQPALSSLRAINRLANSLRLSLPSVIEEVYLPDFILLEAVKVFKPTTYALLATMKDQVVATNVFRENYRHRNIEKGIEGSTEESIRWLTQNASDKDKVWLRTLLYYLFPSLRPDTWGGAVQEDKGVNPRISNLLDFETYFDLTTTSRLIDEELRLTYYDLLSSSPSTFISLLNYQCFNAPRVFRTSLALASDWTSNNASYKQISTLFSKILEVADSWTNRSYSSHRITSEHQIAVGEPVKSLLRACIEKLLASTEEPFTEQDPISEWLAFEAFYEVDSSSTHKSSAVTEILNRYVNMFIYNIEQYTREVESNPTQSFPLPHPRATFYLFDLLSKRGDEEFSKFKIALDKQSSQLLFELNRELTLAEKEQFRRMVEELTGVSSEKYLEQLKSKNQIYGNRGHQENVYELLTGRKFIPERAKNVKVAPDRTGGS